MKVLPTTLRYAVGDGEGLADHGVMRRALAPDVWHGLSEVWRDALSVVAPTECSGCGAPDRAVCASCLRLLTPRTRSVILDDDGEPVVVHSALEYAGVTRRLLLAFKDAARTDAASALARPLCAAIRGVIEASDVDRVRLATIPSSRAAFRRRGFHPVELVVRAAGLALSADLVAARQTRDQAGLGLGDRARNRHGSLRSRGDLAGRSYLVVDDIVTTGATMIEAKRAIEAGSGVFVGGASIAFTPRRIPIPEYGPIRSVSLVTSQQAGSMVGEKAWMTRPS
jgi:predicted amidophosphoribosyltransferase